MRSSWRVLSILASLHTLRPYLQALADVLADAGVIDKTQLTELVLTSALGQAWGRTGACDIEVVLNNPDLCHCQAQLCDTQQPSEDERDPKRRTLASLEMATRKIAMCHTQVLGSESGRLGERVVGI